jgi:hypothetical protein
MVKKLIDTSQLIGLITYFRYNFSTQTAKTLKIFDNYNFDFLNVYCTIDTPPLRCYYYQNIIAPGLLFIIYAAMYYLAFVFMSYK